MDGWSGKARKAGRYAAEVVAETLWPTRCALCDVPGRVLCPSCARRLPYLDWWRACRRCGSPWGLVQCDACNPISLGRIGRAELPYAACASATVFSEETGRLVRVCKDQGEQRLAGELAALMLRAVPPSWPSDGVAFVPATLSAVRHRGFDHAELLAGAVSRGLGAPLVAALSRPRTRDQRALTGAQRVANLAGGFSATAGLDGLRLILVDDVYTTGATACAATDALLAGGAAEVRVLTFARV